MKESCIEKKVCDYAKTKGFLSYKLQGMHNKGLPDRLFLKNGNVFFIEFKAPKKSPTKLQLYTIKLLQKNKFEVYVLDNVEKGIEIIDKIHFTNIKI